jgi:adenylate cyclase
MPDLKSLTAPADLDLLVSFCDLTLFSRYAQNRSSRETFDFLSDYYEFLGGVIEEAGGLVVKFMGDASLIVFDEAQADKGIGALLRLKTEGDAWMADRGAPCRHVIKVHFGQVTAGPVGTKGEKRLDLFGLTVNTTALLRSHGFAMTPQAFRKLSEKNRRLFKKHTPPVTYIPLEEPHRD